MITLSKIYKNYDNLKVLLQDMDAMEYCDFVDSVDRIFMNDKSQMIN